MTLRKTLLILSLLLGSFAKAQDTTAAQIPAEYLSAVSKRVGDLEQKLDHRSERALRDFQKREERLYHKFSRLDSAKAKQYLSASKQQYDQLQQKLKGTTEFAQYIPYLDTLKTSLKFLGEHRELLSKAKDLDEQLSGMVSKVNELEQGLAQAETIKSFLKERRTQLREQLGNLPFARDLKRFNKKAYYYSAQVNEYKEVLKDKRKLERKALELLSKTKPFQEFMRKNSQLAQLFRLPGRDAGDPSVALQGLQTRAQVNSLVQQRIALGGPGAAAQVQQNLQAAQAQLSELKNQLAQYSQGSYSNASSDLEVPDFRPNSQKTKSFRQRLELATNVQSQKARYFFPVTTDVGLSIGFKPNDKSVVGVGASYKVGLGTGWQNIELTHQGVGLRSFVDYKLKGRLYISCGYEQNFRNEIRSIDQLKDYSAWQSSGLLGLSKQYKVSKKLKGEMKLLWDFLSYRQVPKTEAILFRVGYSFK